MRVLRMEELGGRHRRGIDGLYRHCQPAALEPDLEIAWRIHRVICQYQELRLSLHETSDKLGSSRDRLTPTHQNPIHVNQIVLGALRIQKTSVRPRSVASIGAKRHRSQVYR